MVFGGPGLVEVKVGGEVILAAGNAIEAAAKGNDGEFDALAKMPGKLIEKIDGEALATLQLCRVGGEVVRGEVGFLGTSAKRSGAPRLSGLGVRGQARQPEGRCEDDLENRVVCSR